MSGATKVPQPKTAKSIGFLVLKILLALLFLLAASAKLAGVPRMVIEFGMVGLGQWFRYFTACVEIIAAVLLLWPGKTMFGAILLTAVCIGAFFAQLLAIHQDVIHPIVLSIILASIAWTQRSQFSSFLKLLRRL